MLNMIKDFISIVASEDLLFVAAYICSIAFQLAAGLLLIGNTAISRDGIIRAYCAQNSGGIVFEEDGNLADDWSLKEIIKTSWINRCAFCYLFVGYLLNIFGKVPADQITSVVIIIVIMTGLVEITHILAEYKSQKFGSLCLDDIPLENGVRYEILEPLKKEEENNMTDTYNESHTEKRSFKKSKKFYNYDFNFKQEFLIYRKACGKKLTQKENRIVGAKIFYRYNEWSTYVEKKYQKVTVNSLCEFKRFLNHKLRISKKFSGAYGTIISPFMFMLIGALSSLITRNFIIIVIFYILITFSPVKKMLKEYSNETLEIVFYEDYIEVIDRLIKKKESAF